jgi:uncharacterized iron-regulated membrane protein
MKRLIAWLIPIHRYLGIAFCVVFLVWFVSGIVMVYKRMPSFSAEERLARLPRLNADDIRVSAADAVAVSGLERAPLRVRLVTQRSRPVYQFSSGQQWATVFADEGARLTPLSSEDAVAVVAEMFPEHRATIRYLERRTQPDQWTLSGSLRALGPLHRIGLGDVAATDVYVAEATGEIVMKADRAGRFWGFAGAVLHWIYFTPLRTHTAFWAGVIIYGSLLGCVLCLTGIIVGLQRYSFTRRYQRQASRTPYSGWLRWHHYAGLLFGLVTFAWVLSGLLSMTPWGWSPGNSPTAAQTRAVRGGDLNLAGFAVTPRDALAEVEKQFAPKEIELRQFLGARFYISYRAPVDAEHPLPHVLIWAGESEPKVGDAFDRHELLAAARAAMPGIEPGEVAWLTEYDAYYYDKSNGRRLPVLRVKFDDPARTWLYLDAHDGALVQREVRRSRIERWLYHGLHSLDFPGLYQSALAWQVLVLVLSGGGICLSVTSLAIAWRRLNRDS